MYGRTPHNQLVVTTCHKAADSTRPDTDHLLVRRTGWPRRDYLLTVGSWKQVLFDFKKVNR